MRRGWVGRSAAETPNWSISTTVLLLLRHSLEEVTTTSTPWSAVDPVSLSVVGGVGLVLLLFGGRLFRPCLVLAAAVAGETHEYTDMYPGMAKTAREEGFDEIADWFETLAKAEKSHAGRFQKALDTLS